LKISFLQTAKEYIISVYLGAASIKRTLFSILPYQLGMGLLRREVTEQYPDRVSSKTQEDLPAKYRGVIFNEIDKCNASKICQSVCPAHCIEIEVSEIEEFKKKWINLYAIDLSKCIYCGICVEMCPSGSLKHTKNYESSVTNKEDLIINYGKGIVSALDKEKLKAKERL